MVTISRRTALCLRALLLASLVGAAVHVDWHLARPGPHRLSFDLRYHWLSAVPVFGFVTWYAVRSWPRWPVLASLALIGTGLMLGQTLEPAVEMLMSERDWSQVMPPVRVESFLEFLVAGIVTNVLVLLWLRRGWVARKP